MMSNDPKPKPGVPLSPKKPKGTPKPGVPLSPKKPKKV